jgi:hypothetical protein
MNHRSRADGYRQHRDRDVQMPGGRQLDVNERADYAA